MWRRLLIGWLLAVLAATARAHDPGLSTARVVVGADRVDVVVTFATADLQALRPPDPVSSTWISGLISLRAGADIAPDRAVSAMNEEGELQFSIRYPRPSAGGTVELRAARLEALAPGHRQFVTVTGPDGAALAERLLSLGEPSLTFAVAAGTPTPAERQPSAFWAFLKLGVEHIWKGYDHLLFLFGLLVVCVRFKSSVAIISCFTLAHSITLALATLDIVSLPGRYAEPLIAASIVYVGVENLLRRGAEPRGRWALTFLFGLIHGFGFAGVLRELGVGADGHGLALPLFSFNLGVELGQIAVAAVVLPIIWKLRKNEKFLRRGVPALSAVVALAGLYWLLERTLFA